MCATKVYKEFFKILNDIDKLGVVEVTRNGDKTGCYVLSKEEYESMVETMDIMRDSIFHEKILKGKCEPIEACRPLEDVLMEIG
jgi:PHD/YefM family antitoxin component YafN of YafNO toxin-antitoxin module